MDEKKPRLTLDSNLRQLDKALKIAEQLTLEDLAYLQARITLLRTAREKGPVQK